jgi:large subunit ribosomal protein L10
MENPRQEKVAVVTEVRERFDSANAALLTEYRGLNVAALAQLRRALRDAGGELKVYKNTLVRFATRELGIDIEDLLTGPTAVAFVDGDPVNVAKALRDFARTNPNLVVKGGLLGSRSLTAAETTALAEVEPRDVLLAKLAGLMAAPMQQFAGLLQALPRNFAYGLQALIDQGGAPGAPTDAPVDAAPADAPIEDAAPTDAPAYAPVEDAAPADAPVDAAADAPADDTPADEPAAAPEAPTDSDTTNEPPADEAPAEAPAEES